MRDTYLGGINSIFFLSLPRTLGKMIPFWFICLGWGWNHQLAYVYYQGVVMLRIHSCCNSEKKPPCWRVTFAENHMMWSNCSLQVWFSKGWWWWRRLGPLVFRSCLFALLGKIQLIAFKWIETIISMEISSIRSPKKRHFFAYATVSNRRIFFPQGLWFKIEKCSLEMAQEIGLRISWPNHGRTISSTLSNTSSLVVCRMY